MRGFRFPKKIVILAIASVLAIVGISIMKNAMELEDAEQAYYSQWWRWGYDDQPPLYTWLQIGVNTIFGVSKISFSLLRGVLFSAILLACYRFAFDFRKNSTQALSVVLAVVLIPTFIDFTFRRLSHTTLLCLAVIMTYYAVQRLIRNKSFLNYMLLGFVLGVGALAKYNYALVLVAFGGAFFVNTELRKVVMNRNIFGTLLVVVLLLIPHLNWLFSDSSFTEQLQTSISAKTNASTTTGIPFVTPVFSFIASFFKLAWPLLLVLLVLVFRKRLIIKKAETEHQWLNQVFISQVIVLVIAFVAMNVHKVEARWLLPLFLPFLLLLSNYIANKVLVRWNKIGFFLFLFILVIQTIRTPLEKTFKISSSVHYGFEEVSGKLRANYNSKQWVLPNVTYAGSIRLLNSDRTVFSLDDFSLPPAKLNKYQSVFVVNDKNEIQAKAILNDSIIGFGKHEENVYFYLLRH